MLFHICHLRGDGSSTLHLLLHLDFRHDGFLTIVLSEHFSKIADHTSPYLICQCTRLCFILCAMYALYPVTTVIFATRFCMIAMSMTAAHFPIVCGLWFRWESCQRRHYSITIFQQNQSFNSRCPLSICSRWPTSFIFSLRHFTN